jgi:hypothetical protein
MSEVKKRVAAYFGITVYREYKPSSQGPSDYLICSLMNECGYTPNMAAELGVIMKIAITNRRHQANDASMIWLEKFFPIAKRQQVHVGVGSNLGIFCIPTVSTVRQHKLMTQYTNQVSAFNKITDIVETIAENNNPGIAYSDMCIGHAVRSATSQSDFVKRFQNPRELAGEFVGDYTAKHKHTTRAIADLMTETQHKVVRQLAQFIYSDGRRD